MKMFCASLFLLAAVGLVGCESHSTPGGPGAKGTPGTTRPTTPPADRTPTTPPADRTATTPSGTDNKPLVGQAEQTFTLDVPNLSTTVKQGETKTIDIGVKRGKNFDQDVTLKFMDVPRGVTIEPASPVIKHGDKEAKVTVHAADDAAIGDFTVKVVGHPATGPDATNELKLKIAKK